METVSREKASNDPGSVGAPMSGVVVEVRVKDGQEIKKGDPLCGKPLDHVAESPTDGYESSAECHEGL